MNNSNKISVIVPIYNAEKFLNRCINSVVDQTYKNTELILINNGSTDTSRQICETFVEKYKWIKLYNIDNSGVSNARNIGLRESTGDFITFLDADDHLDVDALGILIYNQIRSNADLVIGNYFNSFKGKITPNDHGNYNSDLLLHKPWLHQHVRAYLEAPNRYPTTSYC